MTDEERLRQVQRAIKIFPEIVAAKERNFRGKQKIMRRFMKGVEAFRLHLSRHPWRICPLGKHWVAPHSKRSKNGSKIQVKGFCRVNRSKHDHLYVDEILEISARHMEKLPIPDDFFSGYLEYTPDADVNHLIVGWTKYWNDVLKPEQPLSPNIVKALMASESSFQNTPPRKDGAGQGRVRGLMQVTDQTAKVLKNERGEIKDHYVNVNLGDLMKPSVNICAAVRWLFQKRKLAVAKEGSGVTWDRVIVYYKGATGKKPKQIGDLMSKFRAIYRQMTHNP